MMPVWNDSSYSEIGKKKWIDLSCFSIGTASDFEKLNQKTANSQIKVMVVQVLEGLLSK